ncbi:MAG TPA: heavy metal-binding domain-containing protein [Polyangiaceae bacterium]|nr:heavy metal-binding domain-containing protein [Polyangiaceae bacterium]
MQKPPADPRLGMPSPANQATRNQHAQYNHELPQHARERLASMRQHRFFTSDLSVNEFLLVKEVGFQPLGLVMGSSIFHVGFHPVRPGVSEELTTLTQALYQARELAMVRMEEEADALGADGIVAVRLTLTIHAWGSNVIEFLALGTAVKSVSGEGTWRANNGKPFQSDLSGQDFWTLLHAGYRPVGMVMGNCVYYVAPEAQWAGQPRGWGGAPQGYAYAPPQNMELVGPTQAFYDARELAMERMQAEAEDLGAEGIVGVTVDESNHTWGVNVLEFSAIGTAVVPIRADHEIEKPQLVLSVNG